MKTVKIGIIGAGTVGRGVLDILRRQGDLIAKRAGVAFEVKAVCDRSWEKKKEFLGNAAASADFALIRDDPEIEIVLELIGGREPARTYILESLQNGKSVITANKALLAAAGREIFSAARAAKKEIGFEAAVAGALPVIKSLRRGLIANETRALYGILNGTCNFIITKMQEERMDYSQALRLAQEKGFAEADPSFDVNGNDAAQKLALLAGLAFDVFIEEDKVPAEGIANLRQVDLTLAESMGWVIRLLAVARREDDGSLLLRVHPAMIHKEHILASVVGEKNAVFLDTSNSGPCLIMGLGAGSHPTAAAVISDLVHIARNRDGEPEFWYDTDDAVAPAYADHCSYRYYLRFRTLDQPGVLAAISRVLAEENISIATMHQQEGSEPVDVVLLTHSAPEDRLIRALKKIDELPVIKEPTVHLRIEDHI